MRYSLAAPFGLAALIERLDGDIECVGFVGCYELMGMEDVEIMCGWELKFSLRP